MLVTHHLLRETPPSPGLTVRLQSVYEPRRRDRLPEEAMSEGASETPVWLESLGRLFAKRTPRPKVGPERADEGGGLDVGAALREKNDAQGTGVGANFFVPFISCSVDSMFFPANCSNHVQ